MSPPPLIRILRVGDAPELMALRHRALRECPGYFGTPPQIELAKNLEVYRRQLARQRKGGKSAILGLWQGPHLVGMAGLKLRRQRTGPAGLIYSMYLEPDSRGQGFGKRLLTFARDEIFQRWQVTRCLMNVEVHNQIALKLYQQAGFRIIDTETAAFWIDGRPHDVHLLEWRKPDA